MPISHSGIAGIVAAPARTILAIESAETIFAPYKSYVVLGYPDIKVTIPVS